MAPSAPAYSLCEASLKNEAREASNHSCPLINDASVYMLPIPTREAVANDCLGSWKALSYLPGQRDDNLGLLRTSLSSLQDIRQLNTEIKSVRVRVSSRAHNTY